MSRQLKILVVDDTEPNLLLVSKFIHKLGHQTVLARNGLEAVQQFQNEAPDVVLMDVMMPKMDGYEATAKIRELYPHKWVPIIFLTAKAQDADLVRGIQVGGDDYVTKPVNLIVLQARIKAVTRIAEMQRQIVENAELLEDYRDENEREMQLAKHLIEKITRYNHFDHEQIHFHSQPAQHFSGDIFIAAQTPADEVHMLLADGTGHGLSAALNVIPVVEVFYGMTSKGFGISSIAHELNRKIKQLMPTERFVAATLVSVNLSDQTLHIWNGGNPPALFVSENGQIQRRWKSAHPALGIFSETEFDATTEMFHWNEPGRLYLCSDGLVEAQNSEHDEFGQQRLEQILCSSPPEFGCDRLLKAVERHMAGFPAHDDISLATFHCTVNDPGELSRVTSSNWQTASVPEPCSCRWKVGLRLTASELKEMDVVPMLLGWMDQLRLNPGHRNQIFLIFTELFNNALDHGILRLDSSLKHQPDGFERYFEQRRQRLADLQHGVLEIDLERLRQQGHEILTVHIKDSGDGFEYKLFSGIDIGYSTKPSGRGLALIHTLCSKVEFACNGSEITAYFTLA